MQHGKKGNGRGPSPHVARPDWKIYSSDGAACNNGHEDGQSSFGVEVIRNCISQAKYAFRQERGQITSQNTKGLLQG